MEQRFLGRTGLRVPALSFGAMTFGGDGRFSIVGTTQLDEAKEVVARCIDAGATLFDTADVYSMGRSEEILGGALAGRRDEVLIATKLHGRMGEDPNAVGQSRAWIMKACEASLRRLGTDHIDLYQVHGFDALTPLEETLDALDDLVRAGKVRYTGCSNYSAWHLMKAQYVADSHGLARFASLQAYYSLVARELEHELVPACLDQGVGVLVWGPLAAGLLSGKFRRGADAPDVARRNERGDYGTVDLEQAFDVIDVLAELAAELGATVAQVALAWLLRKPAVSSVIVGARTLEQLEDNLGAARLELPEEAVARLDAVSARPLPYPLWHQQQFNGERLPEAPSVASTW